MSRIKNSNDKIAELRRQLEEAEAEQKAAEREEERRISKAKRLAGANHTRTVLDLYELLGIEPEHEGVRMVNGTPRPVSTDKDERHRTQRLFEFIEGLVEEANASVLGNLHTADDESRDSRRPQPKDEAADEFDDEAEDDDDEGLADTEDEPSFNGYSSVA